MGWVGTVVADIGPSRVFIEDRGLYLAYWMRGVVSTRAGVLRIAPFLWTDTRRWKDREADGVEPRRLYRPHICRR